MSDFDLHVLPTPWTDTNLPCQTVMCHIPKVTACRQFITSTFHQMKVVSEPRFDKFPNDCDDIKVSD